MHDFLKGWIADALKRIGRKWNRSVEFGCGTGDGGLLLRQYTNWLVGVDTNPKAVEAAKARGVYDEVHIADARTWPLEGYDSVFAFEFIEHIPKAHGYMLLRRIGDRFVMLSTPLWSLSLLSPWPWDGHQCVWSEQDFKALGFKTETYSYLPDVTTWILYGGIMLAVRG